MKSSSTMIFSFILFALAFSAIAEEELNFKLDARTFARVKTDGQEIVVVVRRKNKEITRDMITLDTQKKFKLHVEDYNFDGFKDFSFSYIDEGQGIFSISRIFIYSPIRKNFIEAQPACGDEFLNLTVKKKNRKLISTFFEENKPKLCKTKLQ